MGTATAKKPRKAKATTKTARAKAKPKAAAAEARESKAAQLSAVMAESPHQPKATQMNIRIDADLKKRGDEALARAGYTPSQAVRRIWEMADRNQNNPQAIRDWLDPLGKEDEAARQATQDERRAAFLEDANIISNLYKKLGIVPSNFTREASYKELKELAVFEKMKERGLDA